MSNNSLDKFYTNPIITDYIINIVRDKFEDFDKKIFIEPCAGSGNFVNSLLKVGIKKQNILAYDIEPHNNKFIKKQDYLKLNIKYNKNNITIGNPPFGKNGKLALQFLNKSLNESDIVIFILPLLFKRYSVQKQVSENAKLVYEIPLPVNSFLVNDKEYKVNCILQIWTNNKFKTLSWNKRIKQRPLNKINGIQTFIYNNTKTTLKYFDKDKYKWDFAVVRQGYYDYNQKVFNPNELQEKRQYMFIRILEPKYKTIIDKIDFNKLSKTNTIIPGFSTTDFIKEFLLIKQGINLD